MADAVMIDFGPGMDQQVYDQVNEKVNPAGNAPAGLVFHSAGLGPDGNWRVVDVWESQAVFDSFFAEKIQPALVEIVGEQALSQGTPPTIASWPIHNHNTGS